MFGGTCNTTHLENGATLIVLQKSMNILVIMAMFCHFFSVKNMRSWNSMGCPNNILQQFVDFHI